MEPLEPPISISTMDTARVDSLIAPWSMAANPAVRVVTDWKAPASSFWGTVIGPRVAGLFHSMAQINPAPIKIKRPEQVKTSLEYTDRRRRLRVRTARSQILPNKKTQAAHHNERHNGQADDWILLKQHQTAARLQNA